MKLSEKIAQTCCGQIADKAELVKEAQQLEAIIEALLEEGYEGEEDVQ